MSLGSSYRSPNASAGSVHGPSGLTDSDDADEEFDSPGFSFLAPSGYTGDILRISTLILFWKCAQMLFCRYLCSCYVWLGADSDSEEDGEEVQSRPFDSPNRLARVKVPTPAQQAAIARKSLARQLLLVSLPMTFLSHHQMLCIVQLAASSLHPSVDGWL